MRQNLSPGLDGGIPESGAGLLRGVPPETFVQQAHRIVLGTAWTLKPGRLADVLPTLAVVARHYLAGGPRAALPESSSALVRPDGLAGICDRLTPDLVLSAYRRGLFPWSHVGPQKWWAIARRSTLFFENYRLEKSVRRALRQQKFRVTLDEDFDGVVRACAEPRSGRTSITWIRPQIIDVFRELHRQGHAHSVEVRDDAGTLVGGAYGLVLGKVFFTESQFFRVRDASKVGFAVLNHHLQHWGFAVNDAKEQTTHLENLGFTEVSRDEHNAIVAEYGAEQCSSRLWTIDVSLDTETWRPAEAKGLRRSDVFRSNRAPSRTEAIRS